MPPTPALTTATSRPPSRSAASRTPVDHLVLVTDVDRQRDVGSRARRARSSTATRAPAACSAATVAAPMPLAPPVTIAAAPESSMGGR